MLTSQSYRAAHGKMFQLKNAENGHRMAPGRQFEVFGFGTTGVGPKPVRGPFVAVTDQNGTLVGGKERSCVGDSGSVIRSVIGGVGVTGCWSKDNDVGLGPVERRE